jgi:alkanesulfonate monooxygenase SsuD/methylene tetrahydromethanopterin reductase-like flavin-dependent oxidoreductase (luciferase family)
MEYFLNLPGAHFNKPAEWASAMEAQGWDGICASDHVLVGTNPYPHVFVTAMAMAAATDRITLTTSFANNLFRSPVEFAQAAFALQCQSGGRFEAGLGAGWAEHEMNALGLDYPAPRDRVGMYIEALAIVRQLLHTGQCQFSGAYYNIDISGEYKLGPMPATPPPLVASAGGPRNIRESTPLVDRIEIKAASRGTRGGALDLAVLATVTEDEIKKNFDRVKSIDPDMPVGIFLLVGADDSPLVAGLKAQFGNGFLGHFLGHPEDVAQALENLSAIGIARVQLTEIVPGSQENLQPFLVRN